MTSGREEGSAVKRRDDSRPVRGAAGREEMGTYNEALTICCASETICFR